MPFFLKLDIEGLERACINRLRPLFDAGGALNLPTYLSIEGGGWNRGFLPGLLELTYSLVKVVDQSPFTLGAKQWGGPCECADVRSASWHMHGRLTDLATTAPHKGCSHTSLQLTRASEPSHRTTTVALADGEQANDIVQGRSWHALTKELSLPPCDRANQDPKWPIWCDWHFKLNLDAEWHNRDDRLPWRHFNTTHPQRSVGAKK